MSSVEGSKLPAVEPLPASASGALEARALDSEMSGAEPWTCQVAECNSGQDGGPYQTQKHRSRAAHLEEMQLHVCCTHPGVMTMRTPATAPAPAPEPKYLASKSCEFPGCTWSTPADELITVSERQVEMQLHITMKHSGGSGTVKPEDRGKCQTQTKVDRPALKAKTSATEWVL